MNYLSASELAELIGCKRTSYMCMKRWLAKNGWPFAEAKSGPPRVSRTFHDAKLMGNITIQHEQEPDFSAFQRP